MTARFTSKNVLVTGGGAGIGRAIALAFAREGAAVVVAGRSEEPLNQTVKFITDGGARATASTADVTRSEDVAALVAGTVAAYGGLDVAVNNAGTLTAFGPVGDIDEDQWSALVAVNLTGTLLSMKHEIAYMRRHGGGAIINVASSLGAHMRLAGLGAYVATKAAVSALTRNAALDHIGDASGSTLSVRARRTRRCPPDLARPRPTAIPGCGSNCQSAVSPASRRSPPLCCTWPRPKQVSSWEPI